MPPNEGPTEGLMSSTTRNTPRNEGETRAPDPNRFKKSKTSVVGLVLGLLAFLGLCILIATGALGGGSTDEAVIDATLPASDITPAASEGGSSNEPADDAEQVREESFEAEAISAPAEEPSAEQEPAVEPEADPEPASDAEPVADADADETDPEADQPEPEEEDVPEIIVRPIGPDSPPIPPGAPSVHSVLSEGKLYMRGTLPSLEIERQVVASVEAIMGPGNGISEYVIDPSSELTNSESSPVYLADTVLFPSGSAALSPEFFELIGITPILLAIQPDVVITITGHTDDVGSADTNLRLSQQRVDTVRDWIIDQGGDGDRVIAVGLGETQPVADNATEEGRRANRRVEFQLEGFRFDNN